MRAVVQRVRDCRITVEGEEVAAMSAGLLVYLGISDSDSARDASYLADKVAHLRIYPDADGKMNLSVLESSGQAVVVSQFTLYGDTRKGRRPSYNRAAPPDEARALYTLFREELLSRGLRVGSGVFQAHMHITATNDGPVTILVDSNKEF